MTGESEARHNRLSLALLVQLADTIRTSTRATGVSAPGEITFQNFLLEFSISGISGIRLGRILLEPAPWHRRGPALSGVAPHPTPSSWSPGCHSLDQRQIRLGPGPNARGPRRHDAQDLPDAGAFTNQSPCAGADGQRGSLGLATRRGTAPHNPQAPRRAPRWMPAKTRTKPLLDLSSIDT